MRTNNNMSALLSAPEKTSVPARPLDAPSIDLRQLFAADEVAWLDEMARLIDSQEIDKLDFLDLKEYLQDMARNERREATKRLRQLVAHLLKWEHQPRKRSRSWETTITEQRFEMTDLLESKTLLNFIHEEFEKIYQRAVTLAVKETGLERKEFPTTCPYSLDFILSDELPARKRS